MALHSARRARLLYSCLKRLSFSVTSSFSTESEENVRVRFAPSPTGMLHLGGLRTALYNYLYARSHSGTFVLRIEDTDQARLVPGAVEKLIEMLTWAGLKPDEGPFIGGEYGPYVQSERLQLYTEMAQNLLQTEKAYRCFCTAKRLELLRKEAARRGEVYRYDNKCRHLSNAEIEENICKSIPSVLRFKLDRCKDPWEDLVYGSIVYDVADLEGDPIIMKSDGFPTYHLANVVDDHFMKISHVLRGEEWQVSTAKHFLLYKAFGWTPPKFAHLPLMLNKDGTKLSKRQGDIHVEQFKDKGYYPDAVLNFITYLGGGFTHSGTDSGGFTVSELAERFSLATLRCHGAKIDPEMINHYNRLHLERLIKSSNRQLVIDDVRKLVQEKLGHRLSEDVRLQNFILSDEYIQNVLNWAVTRIFKLEDLVGAEFDFIWSVPGNDSVEMLSNLHGDPGVLLKVIGIVETLEHLADFKLITEELKKLASSEDIKFNNLMRYLRKALSGLDQGPSVAEIISVLGKEGAVVRLKHTHKMLTDTK